MNSTNFPITPDDPRGKMRLLEFFTLVTNHGPYNLSDKLDTYLYFLDFGKFHKIGITKRDVHTRFKKYKTPYKVLDLLLLSEKDARYLEKRLLGLVDGPYQFKPTHEMLKLGGYTECFYPGTITTFKDLIPNHKKPSFIKKPKSLLIYDL